MKQLYALWWECPWWLAVLILAALLWYRAPWWLPLLLILAALVRGYTLETAGAWAIKRKDEKPKRRHRRRQRDDDDDDDDEIQPHEEVDA